MTPPLREFQQRGGYSIDVHALLTCFGSQHPEPLDRQWALNLNANREHGECMSAVGHYQQVPVERASHEHIAEEPTNQLQVTGFASYMKSFIVGAYFTFTP